MKTAGAIILMLSTTAAGVLVSSKQRECVLICRELLNLCDILSIDISSKKNSLLFLLDEKSLSRLSFITSEMLINKTVPETPLHREDNSEIADFVYSLGKSDSRSQLMLVESFKEYIKNREKYYSKKYSKDSKLNIALGVFGGLIAVLAVI